jgi:CelD/BcsL family acetyltransferase involved in cellulose biosynthesis
VTLPERIVRSYNAATRGTSSCSRVRIPLRSRSVAPARRAMPHTGGAAGTVVTVERISDPAQLPDVAAQWDALIDDRDPGAVFRSSAWLLPWWRRFSDGKELSVYAARVGTRLAGVLPAYRAAAPLGGQYLRLMGDAVTSDYLGVIARAEDLESASAAIARAVLAEERHVLLCGVLAEDPLIAALRQAGRRSSTKPDVCPYLPLDGSSDFSTWIRSRPRGIGAQLRRRRRWLEKRADFRVEILTAETDVLAALPTLWRLHRARWAMDGGTKALADPAVERFHADSARELARRGWVRLYVLHADGAPRAALYGFERGGRFLYYQMGSDPNWRPRAVGTVVLSAALEDAFERGLDEFDFLRGDERYKSLYTSVRRPLVTLRVVSGPRAQAAWVGDRARGVAERGVATLRRHRLAGDGWSRA